MRIKSASMPIKKYNITAPFIFISDNYFKNLDKFNKTMYSFTKMCIIRKKAGSMKKYFIAIILLFICSGCTYLQDTPENAVKNIINAYNSKNFDYIWENTLPESRNTISKNMQENKDNAQLYAMISTLLEKDNITYNDINEKEYLYSILKLSIGSKDLELKKLIEESPDEWTAFIKSGANEVIMPIIKKQDKWFMIVK